MLSIKAAHGKRENHTWFNESESASARNSNIRVREIIQAWLLSAVKRQLVVIAKLLSLVDGSFRNEYNVVLSICNYKSRLAIRTTTVVHITGDVSFFGRVNN